MVRRGSLRTGGGGCTAKRAWGMGTQQAGVGSMVQVPRGRTEVLPLSAQGKGTGWEHHRVPAASMEHARHHRAMDMALMAG